MGADLIGTHQRPIANDVRCKDRREAAFLCPYGHGISSAKMNYVIACEPPSRTGGKLTSSVDSDDSAQCRQFALTRHGVRRRSASLSRGGTCQFKARYCPNTPARKIPRSLQRLMGLPPALRPVGIAAPSPVHLSNRFYAETRAMFPDSPPLSVITPMEKVVEALNRYLPDGVSTYPSFIRRLAEEQVAGRLKIAPILMRSVAEALAPDVRDLMRATWNIPTTNSYASTEAGIMGSECREQSGIHLCGDMFLTEIVDDAYQPVSAGTTGVKVLITILFNRTLPIVRYELSDYLTAIDGPCLCGCAFQRIKDVEGQREEMLQVWAPDGREVAVHAPRFWFHLVRVSGIKQYQFVQLPKGIAIRIVPTVGHNPETVRNEVDRIGRAALSAIGAPDGHLEVQIVETIERSGAAANQKLVASAPAT